MIKVGIIDDDVALAEMMQASINRSERICCEHVFQDAKTAQETIPDLSLDIVLVDLNLLGNKDGIDCIRALKKKSDTLQLIVCTGMEDVGTIFESIQAGAVGYLVKTNDLSLLSEAIIDAHTGGAPMSRLIARKMVQSLHEEVQPKKQEELLTRREIEILELLDQGLRYKEIADRLCISMTTVKKHIYNIYQKLQVSSKIDALNKISNENKSSSFFSRFKRM